MEALEFLKEAQRMCRSEECHLNCPVHDVCFLQNYDLVSEADMKTFISSVEQWSKDHPVMTNAKKFEEVFGFHPADFKTLFNFNKTFDKKELIWWDDPYKEP